MMNLSPQMVYDNLESLELEGLEQVDVTRSAFYRELAQAVLASSEISLSWREAIADRLNQANHRLATRTVNSNDNY
ncbi:MAG: hypothetical protein KME43_25245 [Myxacorys chilensis ATA2-1-KO14]|jgi:hypothetical protein|nr:hypothetical protein [Myxacorys chilensis ATA2-1-KO14]